MHRFYVASLLVGVLGFGVAPAGSSCIGLRLPVDSEIIQSFSPIGRYAGHWGVDLEADPGSAVAAAAAGVVTFSGIVAGNSTISVDHGGGLKTSYSFLTRRSASRGAWVGRGTQVGTTGLDDGSEALHFSVRINGNYVDPTDFLGCQSAPPAAALRLVPIP